MAKNGYGLLLLDCWPAGFVTADLISIFRDNFFFFFKKYDLENGAVLKFTEFFLNYYTFENSLKF